MFEKFKTDDVGRARGLIAEIKRKLVFEKRYELTSEDFREPRYRFDLLFCYCPRKSKAYQKSEPDSEESRMHIGTQSYLKFVDLLLID